MWVSNGCHGYFNWDGTEVECGRRGETLPHRNCSWSEVANASGSLPAVTLPATGGDVTIVTVCASNTPEWDRICAIVLRNCIAYARIHRPARRAGRCATAVTHGPSLVAPMR